MHHFIYPSKDTFISNTLDDKNRNYGLDEILRIGTAYTDIKVTSPTTTYVFPPNTVATNLCVQGFSGSIATGSLYGTASFISGTVFNIISEPVTFTTDFFSGSVTGEVVGWETGSVLSSSYFSGSLVAFSGSISVSTASVPNWNDLIWNYENWEIIWNEVSLGSGSINGFVSGTFSSSYFSIFNGIITGFTGKLLTATVNGSQTLNHQHQYVTSSLFYSRALVQFDLDMISRSVALGDITSPHFTLKMNVAREEELPIQYTIYANPISESWVMGNGYLSDGGSVQGASWTYRNYYGGTTWSMSGSTYVNSPASSQSFNYQVGDINVDITNIVMAWISGTVANNGLLIRSSDEDGASKTGMTLYFFSRDSNTIYSSRLDVAWNDTGWITGSVSTASSYTVTSSVGLYGTVTDTASMSGSYYGAFNGVGNITLTNDATASGFLDLNGTSGIINGWHIYGNFDGEVSTSIWQVFKRCKVCQPDFNEWWPQRHPEYTGSTPSPGFSNGPCSCGSNEPWWFSVQSPWWWGSGQCCSNPSGSAKTYTGGYQWVNVIPDEFGPCGANISGTLVTMSFLLGTLTNGAQSGSTFTASFINGYQLNYGILSGSWNSASLFGAVITASYPLTPVYPTAVYVYLSSFGMALGSLVVTGSQGTFNGTFVNGTYVGDKIFVSYTGSIISASTDITITTLESSSLSPVEFDKPFSTIIQNIPNVVKAGNVIRVNVFARPEFPLKNFNRQTQFEQFLIPQYLPTSSYYSIKDNETEEIIIDFDNYTQISCDADGNYFMLDTTGLPQERYFRILIKTEQSGSSYILDRSDVFKIVR